MLSLLFPGQGSQVVGMGRDLVEAFPAARALFDEADEALGFELSRVMFEGPEDELTATRNAQPALLVHSVAALRLIEDRLGPVAFTAGHSLGEFSAHVAAGTLSFVDAVRAVRRRGELMFDSGEERPGTMAAIIGLDDGDVEGACAAVESGVCVPANFNSPGQVVISGDVEAVEEGMQRALDAGARKAVRLQVSGAFHSPLMQHAAEGLDAFLSELSIADPTVPVVSNVTAEAVTSGSEARELLVRQVTSPVRWAASIRFMVDAGATRFLEIGPGSVLRGLQRRIAREAPCTSVGTLEQIEGLEVES
ncbi:MAG: ACP S-malonyltransferase [Gemmatimonadetes bacterium]|nr:ACP S-malonyltransferase [Gemmatimonadota bacterium]MBT8402922.1 ACP S-malonyltransferase [Gemmatimonadota bacterium]NNK63721.1 ACP S-malonyltransferase [Gemmatimonadota bacterium]